MSVLAAALVSFFSIFCLSWHFGREGMMKICGYAAIIDIVMHVSIIALFLGTSTLGLMQAELCAIFLTIALRTYRHFVGYARLERRGYRYVWAKYPAPSRSFLGL